MKPYYQMTPQERGQAHIDFIKKASFAMTADRLRRARQSAQTNSLRDEIRTEETPPEDNARQVALDNCYAAADDYRAAGNEDYARLYELRARIIGPGTDSSCVKEYYELLDRVRNGRKSGPAVFSTVESAGDWIAITCCGAVIAFAVMKAYPAALPITGAVAAGALGLRLLWFLLRQTIAPKRTNRRGRPLHPLSRVRRAYFALLLLIAIGSGIWLFRVPILGFPTDSLPVAPSSVVVGLRSSPTSSIRAGLAFGVIMLAALRNANHLCDAVREWTRALNAPPRTAGKWFLQHVVSHALTLPLVLISVLAFGWAMLWLYDHGFVAFGHYFAFLLVADILWYVAYARPDSA